MEIIYAIILGIVQGLTEFLPVSSSGHLALLQKAFGIGAPGVFLDAMLHFGTLTAVFAVLWKDIWEILKKIIQPLTLFLIIGTIPAIISALFFSDIIENASDTGKYLGFCFLITSALLAAAEALSKRAREKSAAAKSAAAKSADSGGIPAGIPGGIPAGAEAKNAQSLKWHDALFIGVMQAIALAPGISRSGATISGALFRKLGRDFAARFSFLLSIPAILGAFIFQFKDLFGAGAGNGAREPAAQAAENIGALAIIAGTAAAAVTGFFAVKFMIKIIREKALYGFAVYTGALGLLIIIDQFFTKIVF